jgi:hypothetical protein
LEEAYTEFGQPAVAVSVATTKEKKKKKKKLQNGRRR